MRPPQHPSNHTTMYWRRETSATVNRHTVRESGVGLSGSTEAPQTSRCRTLDIVSELSLIVGLPASEDGKQGGLTESTENAGFRVRLA